MLTNYSLIHVQYAFQKRKLYVIYASDLGYANIFFPETKQISLDFNVIYLLKYLKRAALQVEHISIFANHDDNNVHY